MPSESVASAFCRKALRLNPYSIGTHSPSRQRVLFILQISKSQSLFYWNTLSEFYGFVLAVFSTSCLNPYSIGTHSPRRSWPCTRARSVSILILLEHTLRAWQEDARFILAGSQSLFYWNTLSELPHHGRRTQDLSSQSLFYWNTLSEYLCDGSYRRRPGSQSLFYWNTLSEMARKIKVDTDGESQSLFYWNTLSESPYSYL